jgi:hypothetical protein
MTAFVPTHRVPPAGIDSWPRPDPQATTGPRIEGGLEVQVVDRLGDWAKVTFSNGWTAWVDGRLLVAGSATAARAGNAPRVSSTKTGGSSIDLQAIMADRPKAFAIGGAALIVLSSILPWLRGGGSSNSFKITLQFLFDYKTTSTGGVKVGWLLLAFAVAVVVVIVRNGDERISRGVGIAAIAVSVLYVIQLQRWVSAVSDSGAADVSLTDVVGFGVLPAVAGGVLVTFASKFGAPRG